MAFSVDARYQPINGTASPTPAQKEELYDELLRLRDAVIAGKYPSLKLPASVIEQLKASSADQDASSSTLNGISHSTNQQLSQSTSVIPSYPGLPGLHASPSSSFIGNSNDEYGGKLDPIFLEKSDSLVRAEGQLKRQRLDRDLQAQFEQRKHAPRDREHAADATSLVDVDTVLKSALLLAPAVSGLKSVDAADSSFDENDYYSSQVQSEWSSTPSSKIGSDGGVGAFTADFEPLDGGQQAAATRGNLASDRQRVERHAAPAYVDEDDDMYEPEDEEDDYAPPDASAFDTVGARQPDDDSDYEPGEITQESTVPTPSYAPYQPSQPAPPPSQVPVIRNHLTHIAAPQPNRVSPLATAKGPNIELELVNGSPQVVKKPQQYPKYVPHSRASTASPSGNGNVGSGKKKKSKKRKRDDNQSGRSKRRNRQSGPSASGQQEPSIKDEPVSPPPFSSVPDFPDQARPLVSYRPTDIDFGSPAQPPRHQQVYAPARPGLQYDRSEHAGPTMVRVASPSFHRPVQRDTQDLRRIASLHYAQRPPSQPQVGRFSPVAPYRERVVSMTYGDPRLEPSRVQGDSGRNTTFPEPSSPDPYTAPRASRSPPQYRDYQSGSTQQPYRADPMGPPEAAPRRIIVGPDGQRWIEAGPAPPSVPAYAPRASVVPVETRAQADFTFDRAPSRTSVSYAQARPLNNLYDPSDSQLLPPSSNRRAAPESRYEYVDAGANNAREYQRPPEAEPARYAPEPTSPVYQQVRAYERMPPPAAPPASSSSSSYVQRSYSVHPDAPGPQQQTSYVRQGSVAPIQYVQKDAQRPPARAMSVMPGMDYRTTQQPPLQQRLYSQAPQPQQVQQLPPGTRYVDQNGNPVFPRQISEVRY